MLVEAEVSPPKLPSRILEGYVKRPRYNYASSFENRTVAAITSLNCVATTSVSTVSVFIHPQTWPLLQDATTRWHNFERGS